MKNKLPSLLILTVLAISLAVASCQVVTTTQRASTSKSQLPGEGTDSSWLSTRGNHIYRGDKIWIGRGANIHDTRSCWACSGVSTATSVAEVKRRIDTLVDGWHADFVRLVLEADTQNDSLLYNGAYYQAVRDIVAYIGTKPGVYVLLSIWNDPSLDGTGLPTTANLTGLSYATSDLWRRLATDFYDNSHVIYGLSNEPHGNSANEDTLTWNRMNAITQIIRDTETSLGGQNRHLVLAQGTRNWARSVNYYVTHPITAGGGVNVAYETHFYDPSSGMAAQFGNAAATIPVVVGEFGPNDFGSGVYTMSYQDTRDLMIYAESQGIPYLAWTFHMRCPPNLLADNSGGSCGVNMRLQPSPWGQILMDRLAVPAP